MRNRRMDRFRRNAGELESRLVEDLAAGRLSRREFLRRGTALGVSMPVLGLILSACGDEAATTTTAAAGTSAAEGSGTTTAAAAAQRGGTLKAGSITPSAAVDPVTVADQGGTVMLAMTGEYLAYDRADLTLEPILAESWSPNDDGTLWTFKLRQGVTFHDGSPLTAADVVATIERLVDPKSASAALSVFGGILEPGGTKAVDDSTVTFELAAPNGNFPYLVSSDNYNAIILPKGYTGGYDKTFPGTGPYRLERYTPQVGATFVANPDYWDKDNPPMFERVEWTFFPDEKSQVIALQSNTIQVMNQVSASGAQPLAGNDAFEILSVESSAHRQIHMRTDQEPFTDKRVRQAMALTLDRPAIINALFKGQAVPGNDSPFAPAFPSTDTTVAQRALDIAKAKQLLADAGVPDGFAVTMNATNTFEIPALAQIVQQSAKAIGVTVTPRVQTPTQYYGKATFGDSDWLDSVMGITDYGHRGVPNVLLGAPLLSTGTWNAAHFKNATYDKLVADYSAATDVESQRRVANQIQTLLLDETPIIFPYFYNYLAAAAKNVTGVQPNGIGVTRVTRAGFTA